jgi:quercetin dioxygenase-like cupin family protein
MKHIFPEPIRSLPEADIPLSGIKAFLSQAENHQIIFMQFEEDVDLPEHSHAAQVGIVIEGKIDLNIDDVLKTYGKGSIYYIPAGTKHSGKIYAGYADVTFFDEPHRYQQKQQSPRQ